jgi:hypothetical protein
MQRGPVRFDHPRGHAGRKGRDLRGCGIGKQRRRKHCDLTNRHSRSCDDVSAGDLELSETRLARPEKGNQFSGPGKQRHIT